MKITRYYSWLALSLYLFAPDAAHGAVFLSPFSKHRVTTDPGYDILNNQQDETSVRDIVGDNANAGFLTPFDWRSDDDSLGFRVGLDESGGTATVVDLTGFIDAFMRANRPNSDSALGLYIRKTEVNLSHGPAIVSSIPSYDKPLSSLQDNYRRMGVSDGGAAIDLTSPITGNVDWSVSSETSCSSVMGLFDKPSPGINHSGSSQVHSIAATLSRANSLKQDSWSLQSSWANVGIKFSPVISLIPEPGACILMAVASLMLCCRRRLNN